MMKKTIAAAVIMTALGAGTAQAQIATLDVNSLAQLNQLKDQLTTLKNQYENQIKQLEAITGSAGGYGTMGGNSANTAKEKFPDEWDDVYGEDNAYAGTARQTLEQLDQQRQGMSRQDAIDSSRDRIRLKNAHDRAVMQKIYDDNREELEELARLQEAISTATTQKQIEDLQARINISQGTINAQQMRMQSMVSLQDAQQRLYQEQHRQAVRERLTGDGETLKSVSVPTWGN